MSNTMNSLKVINSSVRTALLVGFLGITGYCGWLGYDKYVKPGIEAEAAKAQVGELTGLLELAQQKQAELAEQNDRMTTSLKLLTTDRRVANVEILEKDEDEDGKPYMEVRFTEVDRAGEPIGSARDYTLYGDQFFVDCWIASFEDEYIQQADELRNASIFAFKSIYGDDEKPRDAQRLDVESSDGPPGIYNDLRKRAFEEKIWKDFWAVCNDRGRQKELGIRAAYGQANHMVAQAGQKYQVVIRSSGGVSLTPIENELEDENDSQIDADAEEFDDEP